jgi:polyisoprenoid-binding protein YceI
MTTTSTRTHKLVRPLVASVLFLASAGTALASDWEIDPAHTNAQFSVRHMMVSKVRGQFGKVTGTVNLDDKDVAHSKVQVAIDASTIDTREPKRDEHLKSPDFFDVAKFPRITFTSTKVEQGAKGKLKVTGDLTMHGVTKPVVLAVEPLSAAIKNPWGKTVRATSATATLNRKDWGLTWNKALEAGGVLVGDEIQIQIDAELTEKAAEHAKL